MPNLYAKTLKRAAQVVGGSEQLALRLNVTSGQLALWIAGAERTPPTVFLRAVDLITELEYGKAPSEHDGGAASNKLIR